LPELLPGEGGLTKSSLSVVISDGVPSLDKASRIYYGIHHPIQYNVKVKESGYIPALIGIWKAEDIKDTEQEAYVTANAEFSEEEEDSGDEDDPGEDDDY
jgi:hypothetical protein